MIIPIFPTFKIKDAHKFYLFDFSPNFDGLLGFDFLKHINASINFKEFVLQTPNVILPLYNASDAPKNQGKSFKPYEITIPPRTSQKVKIPVNEPSGIGILNYTNFGKAEMPECLVDIIDFNALTIITNTSENPVKITFTDPFSIELINEDILKKKIDLNCIEKMDVEEYELDELQKENLNKLRLNHCNEEEFEAIYNLCYEFRDIFYVDGTPLTFTNQVKHKINLTDETPIYTRNYRYPEIYKNEVHNQIDTMLKNGIIRESSSPFNSPIWVIEKRLDASKKKKYRIVIDYRKLNEKTIDDKFPLPLIDQILDRLGRACYFTTLDLANGYHQIEMDPVDIPKTAFSTETGHFEFLRMSFGLKNAPATFQRVMNNVLRGFQNEICYVYLDDIIVFSSSLQEHVERLRKIFERIRQSNLKIQLDKSEFLHTEVAYLGHVITKNGVLPNPEKINAVKNFPLPVNQKQIKSFLGLAGYYRRFINNFAKIAKPLTNCLKKNSKVIHSPEFVKSFNHLKELLINAPILKYPDFSQPFILTTDASNVALGAVLSQGSPPNDHPVAYASRTLNQTEQKYSTIEKELLAIVWACKTYRPYLYGRKFVIQTDHRPLVWLFNLKEPNSKLLRWRLKLEEFDYTIKYKPGKTNIADPLSRINLNAIETESHVNNPGDIDFDIDQFLTEFNELQNPEQINPNNNSIENPININPENNSETDTAHSGESSSEPNFALLDEIINNKSYQLIVKKSPYNSYLKRDLEIFDGNKIIKAIVPNEAKAITQFLKENACNNTLYIYFLSPELRTIFQEVWRKYFTRLKIVECTKLVNNVLPEERNNIIKYKHEGKTNHRGITETLNALKLNYYWKSMKKDITEFINNCETCQKSKYHRKPPNEPLVLTNTPSKPFEILHIDTYKIGNNKFLTIIDKFSKFGQALSYFGTSISACQQLVHFFTFFGIPKQIVADCGGEFKNDVIKELLKTHKIDIHFTTPHHHESNSPVERFHSTLTEHLRLLKEQDKDADIISLMPYALIAYNNTIHSSTGFTPYELISGHTSSRDAMSLIPTQAYTQYVNAHKSNTQALYSSIQEKTLKQKQKIISRQNKNRNPINPPLGSKVYRKIEGRSGKQKNKFNGPYILTKILENGKIEIENPKTKNKIIVHINETKIISPISDASSEFSESVSSGQPPSNSTT